MNLQQYQCEAAIEPEEIVQTAREAGFHSVGILPVEPVEADAVEYYKSWIAEGAHGGMEYLNRYDAVRANPALLLDGARSLLMFVLPYYHAGQAELSARIAAYAHGSDYHEIVRERLEQVASRLQQRVGGNYRAMTDTAPLRERYWAERAGVGFIGLNSQLIVPGGGSWFFIGALLTDVALPTYAPNSAETLRRLARGCLECHRCVGACPGGAIAASGRRIDARRCLSYLTIEHRGEFADDVDLHGHIYGCDECQNVCPHNVAPVETSVGEFGIRSGLAELTARGVVELTGEQFSGIFRHSAIKRTRLEGLRRNAMAILRHEQ